MAGLFFPNHLQAICMSVHLDFFPGLFRQDTQRAWWAMLQFKVAGFLPFLLHLLEGCLRLVPLVTTSFSVTLDILCARLWCINTQSCDTYMYEVMFTFRKKIQHCI